MQITLNNNKEEFEHPTLTVQELLDIKRFTFKMLVVKINNNVIKKDQYSMATITDGDNVTVLHLVSGG